MDKSKLHKNIPPPKTKNKKTKNKTKPALPKKIIEEYFGILRINKGFVG